MNETRPGCLTALLRLFGIDLSRLADAGESNLPYRLRDDFLSPAELSFFRVLQLAVGDRYTTLAKVNLADLLFVTGRENVSYRNKIDRKHVDFLLCEPTTMRPLCAVELDDQSHRRVDRQKRDAFVNSALAAAGLRLVRIPAKKGYSLEDLCGILSPKQTVNRSGTNTFKFPMVRLRFAANARSS